MVFMIIRLIERQLINHFYRAAFLLFFNFLIYDILLGHAEQVVDRPIQYQTCWEEQHERGEDNRQELHDFCLHWICWLRIQLLLDEHGSTHQ